MNTPLTVSTHHKHTPPLPATTRSHKHTDSAGAHSSQLPFPATHRRRSTHWHYWRRRRPAGRPLSPLALPHAAGSARDELARHPPSVAPHRRSSRRRRLSPTRRYDRNDAEATEQRLCFRAGQCCGRYRRFGGCFYPTVCFSTAGREWSETSRRRRRLS